jgi:hypothetical protein
MCNFRYTRTSIDDGIPTGGHIQAYWRHSANSSDDNSSIWHESSQVILDFGFLISDSDALRAHQSKSAIANQKSS